MIGAWVPRTGRGSAASQGMGIHEEVVDCFARQQPIDSRNEAALGEPHTRRPSTKMVLIALGAESDLRCGVVLVEAGKERVRRA